MKLKAVVSVCIGKRRKSIDFVVSLLSGRYRQLMIMDDDDDYRMYTGTVVHCTISLY